MTLPLIGEFVATMIYLICGTIAISLWALNPFLAIIPINAAIYYFLFAPNVQDSCVGYYVGSCRLDRWLGKNEWFLMRFQP